MILAALVLSALPLVPGDEDIFHGRLIATTGFGPVAVAAVDLGGDTLTDLVVALRDANRIAVLAGTGGGTLGPSVEQVVGFSPLWIVAADLDGDGQADVATADFNSDGVSVLIGDGAGGLLPAVGYAVANEPRHLVAADLNGDGRLDLATANDAPDVVSLRLAAPGGGYLPLSTKSVSDRPFCVDAGDIDEDGDLDLVTCNYGSPTTFSILLGDGAGGWAPHVSFQAGPTAGTGGTSVEVADLDADGHVDLVASDDGDVLVRKGNGTVTFAVAQSIDMGDPNGNVYQKVRVADLDGDGWLDALLPIENFQGGKVGVRLGSGPGGLGALLEIAAAHDVTAIDVAELSGDGRPDIAVAHDNNQVTILVGNGAGGTLSPAVFALPAYPNALAVADLDLDGALDAFCSVTDSGVGQSDGLVVLDGDGTGGFVAEALIDTGANPNAVAAGDLDGDGWPDVLVTDSGSSQGHAGSLVVVPNDGAGGWAGATAFSSGYDTVEGALADIDGDGHLDAVAFSQITGFVFMLGDGTGALLAPTLLPVVETVLSLLARDLDSDGDVDLLYGSSPLGPPVDQLALRRGDGTGGFGAPEYLELPPVLKSVPTGLVVADVDEDGLDDLVVTCCSEYVVHKGDGAGGFTLWFAAFLQQAAEGLAVGDVDGDGHVDVVGADDHLVQAFRGDGSAVFALGPRFTAVYAPRLPQLLDADGDGWLDLLVASSKPALGLLRNRFGPWTDLGQGLAGGSGMPRLMAGGTLLPSSPIGLSMHDGPAGGAGHLVLGGSALLAPFKGGVMVPLPDTIIAGLPLDAQGGFSAGGTWYGGLPAGTSTWWQVWFVDPGGPAGWSATNALLGVTP